MKSLFAVLTVAKFESKVLLRSWFFRILAFLSLTILALLDYLLFVRPEVPWMLNGMSGFIPYLDLLLLNVVQAVVGVFLATEFLKDDRRLDITEVIYPHSMTNSAYVLGKLLGVLLVFGALNLIVLAVGSVYNLFFTELPFMVAPYLWYLLLISLPTLVFIFGLTYLLMALVRSQALSIILLLGYIIATLFFLSFPYHYLFDYMAFNVPLAWSEIVGFGDLTRILEHRGVYFLLGLGFTLICVLLLKRLPQSRLASRMTLFLAVASLAGAFWLGRAYIHRITGAEALRESVAALNREYRAMPRPALRQCNLDLVHAGSSIEATARLGFLNNGTQPLEHYLLSLNPGLAVTAVTRNGEAVPFERKIHLLTVTPARPLAPGERDSLTVSYRGAIDERACYPDIGAKTRAEAFRMGLYNIDKRMAFLTPGYVLLTPESLWYPKAGLSAGAAYPVVPPEDFIDFSLRVKTAPGLTAVSQGAVSEPGPGEFAFRPEVPLPQISLAIGPYEKRSLTVVDTLGSGDSTRTVTTDYNLYIIKGHDFFTQYFTAIDSALPGLIRDTRAQYEHKLGLEYPFRRLSLVETPLQFYTYPRDWTLASENVQPETVYLPEKGITLQPANFRSMSYFMKRSGQRGGRQSSEAETQRNMLQQFISSSLLANANQFRTMKMGDRRNRGLTAIMDRASCSVLPLFQSYVSHFSSADWPLFNLALEIYFNRGTASEEAEQMEIITRAFSGMTEDDRANLVLSRRSLAEVMATPETDENVYQIMEVKCDYLFNYLRSQVGETEFKSFITRYFKSNAFSDRPAREFVDSLSALTGSDLGKFMDAWLNGRQIPAFRIGSPGMFEIADGPRTRYQILLKVTNESEVDGLVGVNIIWSAGANFEKMWGNRPQNPADEKMHLIKAGQTKDIGIVLDQAVHALWLNTYLSQNLPNCMVLRFEDTKPRPDAVAFEGERLLEAVPATVEAGVIIVDNEDPGFELKSTVKKSFLKTAVDNSFLKKFLHRPSEDKNNYTGLLGWRTPPRWSNTLYDGFFGRYRHSGYYVKAGKGENKAAWNTELPGPGKYELSFHCVEIPEMRMTGFQNRGKKTFQDFHFTVYDDDGVKDLNVDIGEAKMGWYSLGVFRFPEGKATLELSDESKGTAVYADAARWTLRD